MGILHLNTIRENGANATLIKYFLTVECYD